MFVHKITINCQLNILLELHELLGDLDHTLDKVLLVFSYTVPFHLENRMAPNHFGCPDFLRCHITTRDTTCTDYCSKGCCRYGARVGGTKYYAINLMLRLFLYHFLHTMSSWCHKSIHNNTNNQQTPPPWWWSRLPLQRHGFNESTPPEWQVALLMFVPRPLLKGFGRINKLK